MARVAIIGSGWGTRVQVPAFTAAGLDVVHVRARDDWRSAALARDVDLVSIVTPPSSHREMALAALDAGKHVICEKPTALDAAEASQMLDAARQRGGQLALIDHELRFLPSVRAAQERIAELGGVRYAEVRYASPGRGDRSREWNWWSDAAHGGGIWGAVGSHFVDLLRYLGMEIDAVQSMMRTVIEERSSKPVTSDDFAHVNLRLRGGATASMTFSAVAAGPDEPATLTIHGESGAMRIAGESLLVTTPMKPWQFVAGGELASHPGNSPGGAFGTGTRLLGQALRRWFDGDRNALAFAATFEDGLAQQRVLDAARASHAQGGTWVKVAS